MSSISSSIGIISGLPIQELVDSLIAVQRRPILLMQNRVAKLTQRRTAFLGISAQLLAIRNAAVRFGDSSFFQKSAASSTNESSILATAVAGAAVGQYTFTVRNLAATHSVISNGFATTDQSPVGAGTLTIENSAGRVDLATRLSSLNGGSGVSAGRFRVTDRSGNSADIDLVAATTIQDVLDAINHQTTADVIARVDGDHLEIEDLSGGTGTLVVSELNGGETASTLGLLGSGPLGVITGSDLVYLNGETRLDELNDGNGVRRLEVQTDFQIVLSDGTTLDIDLSDQLSDDTALSALNGGAGVPAGSIRITNRAGVTVDVDLSAAVTLGDVKTAISAAGADLAVSYVGGTIVVTDQSTGEGETIIEEIDSGGTAEGLGLLQSSSTGAIAGDEIYSVETLGDVLRLINTNADNVAGGNALVASVSADGLGITLTDSTGTNLTVVDPNDSGAASDLGIIGAAPASEINSRRLIAGLDTVLLRSLNGGGGVDAGTISLSNRAGVSVEVDLSSADTLADVVSAINASGSTITASVNASGLGIELNDSSTGLGNLIISDVSGTTASDLNIAGSFAASTVSSGNLQRQYISSSTRLSALNNGRGVPSGKLRITDSTGESRVLDLTQGEETLRDVIRQINSLGIAVEATINVTGDGLLLTDTGGGGLQLKVVEEGGTTAKALGILGEAAEGEDTIDGSFETRVTIGSADTLDDVVEKLRDSRAAVNASIINDGAADRPYRLNVTSEVSGRVGQLAIDVGDTGLSFGTLTRARDAVVLLGSPDDGTPLVLTSSTNTLDRVIAGVRLELIGPDEQPVTVTVTRDIDALVSDLQNFVSAFNSAISAIKSTTSFDQETETRGILLGDSTVNRIRSRLISVVTAAGPGLSPPFNRLTAAGITLGSGSTLQFDEDRFREAFEQDPDAINALFTTEETGFGALIENEIDLLTEGDNGLIPTKERSLQDSENILTERIEQLEELLVRRRNRLFAQFTATELALSRLQQQQSALLFLSATLL
ncbi:MAG: flagellar filament capping protein FliD [Planctomycetota bacterium]|nr:flagellar filament capping protein FliD [Planctomycetota bacterium]